MTEKIGGWTWGGNTEPNQPAGSKPQARTETRKGYRLGLGHHEAGKKAGSGGDLERARRQWLIIATHNVRTTAMDGKHSVGLTAEVLDVYRVLGAPTCSRAGVRFGSGKAVSLVPSVEMHSTLNDNGERLLLIAFAVNHELAVVNAFFSTPKKRILYHMPSTSEVRNTSTTFARGSETENLCETSRWAPTVPSFLQNSGHNAVAALAREITRLFRTNRSVRRVSKPSIDRRRLTSEASETSDPYLRKEVETLSTLLSYGGYLIASEVGLISTPATPIGFGVAVTVTLDHIIHLLILEGRRH